MAVYTNNKGSLPAEIEWLPISGSDTILSEIVFDVDVDFLIIAKVLTS